MIVLALAFLALVSSLRAQAMAPPSLEPNSDSGAPSISDDGRFVVFESLASNFVAGDQKDTWDVFLFDRDTGVVTRVSDDGPLGARLPQLSGDGRWIVFLQAQAEGDALALAHGVRRETVPWRVGLLARENDSVAWIGNTLRTSSPNDPPDAASIARDGSRVVFVEREGAPSVVKLYERSTGAATVASILYLGRPSRIDAREPRLSGNGRFLVFRTKDGDLVQPWLRESSVELNPGEADHAMLRDLHTQAVECVSLLALQDMDFIDIQNPRVTDDGRFVAFDHRDGQLSGATHIGFVNDRKERKSGRLLPYDRNDRNNWWQGRMSITWLSADAPRVLVEATGTSDRPEPGRQTATQVYLRDIVEPAWTLISRTPDGNPADADCGDAVASRDLSTIAFWSSATNLVAGDTNNARDIFIVDRKTGKLSLIEARP